MATKIYIGQKGNLREIFRSAKTPTQESHGHKYNAVTGPFRTLAGAKVMLQYGRNNPHLQTVADAERMAKQLNLKK
jgi:hypothetical protein